MANRMCTWFDKLFRWIGIGVVVAGILYLVYRFIFKPNFIILHLDLARQLGI
jgi:hypothetical protein